MVTGLDALVNVYILGVDSSEDRPVRVVNGVLGSRGLTAAPVTEAGPPSG
jgi:hypothetical protein